jgi:DNA-binding response OmpR family regulator
LAGLRSVLIVDDDPDVLRTLARMLRSFGYHVLTAFDAESALLSLAADRPAAALVDLRLTRLDGIAFMRRLRAQEVNQRTPVAIVTADDLLDDAMFGELRALNATVYFKPLWAHELNALTEFLLHGDNVKES